MPKRSEPTLSRIRQKDIRNAPHCELSRRFLSKRDGRLNIIIEKEIDSSHPLLSMCTRYPNNTTVGKIPDKLWQGHYSYNFMTIDNFGYRFEPDRNKLSAIVSFNEPEEKQTLETMKRWFGFGASRLMLAHYNGEVGLWKIGLQ